MSGLEEKKKGEIEQAIKNNAVYFTLHGSSIMKYLPRGRLKENLYFDLAKQNAIDGQNHFCVLRTGSIN